MTTLTKRALFEEQRAYRAETNPILKAQAGERYAALLRKARPSRSSAAAAGDAEVGPVEVEARLREAEEGLAELSRALDELTEIWDPKDPANVQQFAKASARLQKVLRRVQAEASALQSFLLEL